MSDFSPLCHSLPQIENANGTHHSFFDQRKRTESETKFFFFLSSLFVLAMKTKKYFLSLSLYAHLNKYLRCCILGKVRPLQIVTTPRSLSWLSSSLFLVEATFVGFSSKKQTKVATHLKRVENVPLLYPRGRMSCLFRLDKFLFGIRQLFSHIWVGVGFRSGQAGSSTLSYLLSLSLKYLYLYLYLASLSLKSEIGSCNQIRFGFQLQVMVVVKV